MLRLVDMIISQLSLPLSSVEPMESSLSHVERGCVVTGGSRILVVDCAVLIAFDTRKHIFSITSASAAYSMGRRSYCHIHIHQCAAE